MFLFFVYSLLGHNYLAVRLLQSAFGTATVFIAHELGRRIFNERVGLIATIITALYPSLILYTRFLLAETLFILLLAAATLSLYKISARPASGGSIAGLLLGLAALCKPATLLVVPLLSVWFLSAMPRIKDALINFILLCFAMLSVIIPWTIRNYVVFHEFVLISTNGGLNLFTGNNPGATGHWEKAEENLVVYAPKSELEGASEVKSDKIMYKAALTFIRQNPTRFLVLAMRKFWFFWTDNEELVTTLPEAASAFVGWILLLLASVVGIALSMGEWRRSLLLYPLITGYTSVHLVFFALARFRLPLVPLLSIYAGYGIASAPSIWSQVKSGKLDRRVALGLAATGGVVIYYVYWIATHWINLVERIRWWLGFS
jgi:4-amino-4-deoxy-L-arabinose transferase-like glycosyltransferase